MQQLVGRVQHAPRIALAWLRSAVGRADHRSASAAVPTERLARSAVSSPVPARTLRESTPTLSPAPAPTLNRIYVGRQPIYDRNLQVFGYELLYRADNAENAGGVEGGLATSQVVLNTFIEIGLDAIVGDARAFINLTGDLIRQEYSSALPPDRVVIELVEDQQIDAPLVDAIQDLVRRGYRVALDDFRYDDALRPVLELASIVKLDLLAHDYESLGESVARLRQYDVQLVAEKVETLEDFAYCVELGFDYFQGYFFCRPDIVKGQRSPGNRQVMLPLLAKLQDPTAELADLERLVVQDVGLSYKLLRLVNSAYYARATKIESIRQALVLLGMRLIGTWVSLITMTGVEDKPSELLNTAMIRARMCELLAQAQGDPAGEIAFSVGLFSVLDALLDAPLPEIVASLPLSEEVSAALLAHEGPLGAVLSCVLAYERADWDAVDLPLQPHIIADAYLEAIAWTLRARGALVP